MSRQAQIRAAGAQLRRNLADAYRDFDDATGHSLCRRYLGEIGQLVAEVHGREAAAIDLYRAADSIALGAEFPDLKAAEPDAADEAMNAEFAEALATLKQASAALAAPSPRRSWPLSVGLALVVFVYGVCIGWSFAQ